MTAEGTPRVVICGGGVIGASIAHFLTLRGVKPTIIERSGIACAASGKAGGFLALDWCDRSPMGPLARKSFELHAELAATMGAEYGYRQLDTLSVSVSEPGASPSRGRSRRKAGGAGVPEWVGEGAVSECSTIGSTSTTAQVHPELFTKALVQAAVSRGATIRIAEVTGVKLSASESGQHVVGVILSDSDLVAADAVVIAMGPWSGLASHWLPIPATQTAQRAHSIVLQPATAVTPTALFLDYRTADGRSLDPEVYPRPNGHVYICGMSESEPVKPDPSQVKPDQPAIDALVRVANTISPRVLGPAQLLVGQACYLPPSPDGLPLLGKVPGVAGAYVATGHTCWGILNSLASGLAMAELIVDGKATSVNLAPFDPARFP